MKKQNLMILSTIGLILAGCGNNSTISGDKPISQSESMGDSSSILSSEIIPSSTSIEEIDHEHVRTFLEFADLLKVAASKEAFVSNSSTCTETNIAGDVKDVISTTTTIYNGMYSLGKGSLKSYIRDELNVEDEFTEIKTAQLFKYKIEELDYSQLMFFNIKDYKDNASSKFAYQDSASRIYIADNEFEVGELEEGSYISSSEAEYRTTMQHTTYLLNFIDQYFYANAYADQAGAKYMDRNVMPDGTIDYDISVSYTVDGDMNDTDNVKIDFSAKFDKKEERLLSFETSYVSDDVSKADKSNHYLNSMSKTATLTYDERLEPPADFPSPYDYFLASVDEVELLGTNREAIDPSKISPANSYLFITPKAYSPAKAIGVDEYTIFPVSSSNPEAVKVETTKNGSAYFVVAGKGETTLTYSYVGRDKDGFYREIIETMDVNVREYAEPASITIPYVEDTETHDFIMDWDKANLRINTKYRMICNVIDADGSTKNVPQGFSISYDESMVKVENNGGTIYFTPLKAGTFSIKIVSDENPDVFWFREFTVFDNSSVDIEGLLTTHKWTRSWSFIGMLPDGDTDNMNIDASMTFKVDGTGVATYSNKTTSKNYTDPFTWSVKDGKIYIVGLDKCGYYGNGNITYALLSEDAQSIKFYTDEDNAGTYQYKAVAL